MRTLLALSVILGTTAWHAPAEAAPRGLLVCIPGSPGSSAGALSYMAPFFQRIESLAGWPSRSIQGSYQPSYSGCLRIMDATHPGFAVMSLGVYLQKRKTYRLKVLGQVDMFAGAGKQLYLVVRKGTFTSVAQLQGKKLTSNHLEETDFLNRVMFGGKIDVIQHFVLRRVNQTTKGMRDVVRGRADATIINDDELRTLRRRASWNSKLTIIHRSPSLPGAPLVAFGQWANGADIAKMKRVVSKMCNGAQGKKLCGASGIQRTRPAGEATYGKVIRLFGK